MSQNNMDYIVPFKFVSELYCSLFMLINLYLMKFHVCNGQVNATCLETEREALLAFRKGLNDSSSRLSSWVGDDCCQWEGIGCNNMTGHVISMDLNSFWVEGELSDALGLLQHLEYLDLAYNYFSGSIPASIGNLTSLEVFYLHSNKMNGSIPESFGRLVKLNDLNLMTNSWRGVITEAHLMNLSRLETLSISATENGLLAFNISYDWIPPFMLKIIEIHNCKVGPLFPRWHEVQSELTYVTLNNVEISDIIPEEWFSTISSRIISLDLSDNYIKGSLPQKMESPVLDYIDLRSNAFEGPLPLWSTNATQVYFHGNSFSGTIPPKINDLMPRVRNLHLSDNCLNGTIPSSICKLADLQVLSLRNNKLSGELLDCWQNLTSLWVLDVSNNSISGSIPSSISTVRSLGMLLLSSNNLRGEIPSSLQNCTYLTSLDLGENKFSGEIPSWLGDKMPYMFLLRLRSNLFNGSIPRQLCYLQNLHFLDLSNNNLSGSIPNCVNNLTAFIYGNSSSTYYRNFQFQMDYFKEEIMVITKGRELQYGSTVALMIAIDLSANNLAGQIPEEVTSLVSLRSLNLSINHISGSIPEKIGKLEKLETLDLSHNQLSGQIPGSLSSLTSITHLYISYNNLSGRIPTGNQLQTLDASTMYQGNPFLCGPPLQNKCPGDEPAVVPSPPDANGSAEEGENDDSEKLGLLISVGLGFVLGFIGISGALLRKELHNFLRIGNARSAKTVLVRHLRVL